MNCRFHCRQPSLPGAGLQLPGPSLPSLGRVVIASTLLAALVFLAGCSGAGTPMTKPEPPPPPPTLLGTWEKVHYGRNDEGVVDEKETTTLTFTETHFFELHHVQDADGRTRHRWDNAGTVSLTATSVTKSVVDDDRSVSVAKDYFLVDDGDVLLVHTWGDDHPVDGFDRFTRVAEAPIAADQPATLRGTWRTASAWYDDEGDGWAEHVQILTFTGTRAISHTTVFSTDNLEILDDWSHQSGWTDHGTIVTRTFFEDDQKHSVDKQYVIAGDLLAINPWGADEPNEELRVYTRVQNPIHGGIVGTWVHNESWEHDERGTVQLALTFLITADTFTETGQRDYESGDVELFTLSGNLTIDEDNQFLNVAVTSASVELNGEPDEDFPRDQFVGHELRYGYAESSQPDTLLFSPRWSEHDWNRETMMWVEDENHPYGDYWRLFVRQ